MRSEKFVYFSMISSVADPVADAFLTMQSHLKHDTCTTGVLVCDENDILSFDISATQEQEDFMSRVVIILITEDMMLQRSFAADLMNKVETKLTSEGILILLPSARRAMSSSFSYLMLICLLAALCRVSNATFRLIIRKGLDIGYVMRYISSLSR